MPLGQDVYWDVINLWMEGEKLVCPFNLWREESRP